MTNAEDCPTCPPDLPHPWICPGHPTTAPDPPAISPATPLNLDAIRARHAKATPGPWTDESTFLITDLCFVTGGTPDSPAFIGIMSFGGPDGANADRDFVFAAHADMGALIHEADRLRDDRDQARADADRWERAAREAAREAKLDAARLQAEADRWGTCAVEAVRDTRDTNRLEARVAVLELQLAAAQRDRDQQAARLTAMSNAPGDTVTTQPLDLVGHLTAALAQARHDADTRDRQATEIHQLHRQLAEALAYPPDATRKITHLEAELATTRRLVGAWIWTNRNEPADTAGLENDFTLEGLELTDEILQAAADHPEGR